VRHEDFSRCGGLRASLTNQDAALFCLGTYTGAVSDEELRRTTVDYPAAFARALAASSPRAAFCLLSGSGADRTEKSRVAFARYKGAAENAMFAAGLGRAHSFRAGYIYPVVPRKEPNVGYAVLRWCYPMLRRLVPGMVITSRELARAMLAVALDGTLAGPVLENRDIVALVSQLA
jgi:uncharacterized protein YbjT (DUF2867 family)